MTTIYLIRHAEAEGNLYRRIHGWYNALITDNGFQQIKALEDRFRDIPVDAVYSSDLYRTMTTARADYVPKRLPLRTDPGLREISMGSWEDLTWGEARHFHLPALELFNATSPDWSVPNGESFAQLGERMEGTVRHIAQQHLGQTVALFSHGMAIRQFLGRVKAVPPAQWHAMPHGDNTAVSCVLWDGERFAVSRWYRRDGQGDYGAVAGPLLWVYDETGLLYAGCFESSLTVPPTELYNNVVRAAGDLVLEWK